MGRDKVDAEAEADVVCQSDLCLADHLCLILNPVGNPSSCGLWSYTLKRVHYFPAGSDESDAEAEANGAGETKTVLCGAGQGALAP